MNNKMNNQKESYQIIRFSSQKQRDCLLNQRRKYELSMAPKSYCKWVLSIKRAIKDCE
ncbi:hypothetical protein HMPREF9145_0280 [Segatella salivae F0493]|uniref:Uncharacterized protein n=1 Tax=Segatella salivae F0493 TaxID=1395125 RepID=U2KTF5_9BACT|nr:hypothetical protein HMPREF9145_0280 [Segatella salivae F0493]